MPSCEIQLADEKENVQHAILQDKDFVSMMVSVFVMKYHEENGNLTIESHKEHLAIFDNHFNILSKRYIDFHNNVQKALSEKSSKHYNSFAESLYKEILLFTSEKNGRTMSYSAESFCGRPCPEPALTLSCLSGCLYSSAYCQMYGGTNCSGMERYCTGQCCDNTCPEEPEMGN